jgi:uncharacterized repeat protein (TIGR01451 family)
VAEVFSRCLAADISPDGKDAIMNPRGFGVLNALVWSAVFVTTALGQSQTIERKTLAERMSDVRRGWAQGGTSASAKTNKSQSPPEPENRSLIPNWLSGGSTPKRETAARTAQNRPQGQNGAQAQNKAAQADPFGNMAAEQAATPRTVTRSGVAPARTTSAEGFTLPGLGGSPLPTAERAKSSGRQAASNSQDRYGASQEDENYPVIRDVSQGGESSASAGTADVASPRHSPERRPSTNVDPKKLSRELAGSFTGGPAARTARADDSAATTGEITPEAAANASTEAQQNGTPPTDENTPTDAAEAFGAPSSNSPALGNSEFVRTPRSNSLPELPSAARSKEAFGEALQVAQGGDPSVLVSNQTPVISSDIRGPKQILVGREAVYRVRLQNQSNAAAEGIVATIKIPQSAEVIETTATQGTVQPAQNDTQPGHLEWQLPRLESRGSEVIDIRLVPRENRPLELGVSWTLAPIGSRAIVEVQEAQLHIEIGGPSEVLFDKPQVFRLTLSNPGTGPADNVRIDLVPPGAAQEAATSHEFGTLAPGETKTVEIELTAREAGKLMMKAIASAEGGLVSDASKEIFCRKPELELDWRGPATKYAGTPATYFFRVRNPGTAPAEDVIVKVTLPEGVEFTSGSEGQVFNADEREIAWRVGTLGPGDDNYMELKCIVQRPGANQFNVTAATGTGELTDSEVAETNVVAIADLKLSVSDPSGPVAVGSQAVYEIHVANRGANTAKNVNVVALFSDGIEPDQAEGTTYTVADGRVSFQTIEELPAGRDVTLRIRARALQPGTHVFRAEVLCSDLEIKLAAEETTRFYADDVLPDADAPADETTSQSGFESAAR